MSDQGKERKIHIFRRGNRMSEEERQKKRMEAMLREQRSRSELRREEDYVRVEIDKSGPFNIVHLSDIHFGHDAVDYSYLDKVMEYILDTDGVYLMLYGDLLEGFNKEYVDTNNQHILLPLDEQVLAFRERYLKPLYKKGKILGMVSRFTQSHENWTLKNDNLDLYPLLTVDMDIPLIGNGGILEVVSQDDHHVRIRCFHNPPRGGSEISPLSGLRGSESNLPGYVDMVVAGDRHTLGGTFAVEKDPDGTLTVYCHLPPFKGNENSPMPDYLMMAKYGNRPMAAGATTTLHGKDSNGPYIYASQDPKKASSLDVLRRFGDILDSDPAARDEIQAQIADEEEMRVEFNRSKSKSRVVDDEQAEKSLVRVGFDVYNARWINLSTISRLRAGSSSSDPKQLRKFAEALSQVQNNITLLGPQNLDQSTPTKPNRESIVENYLSILNPLIGHIAVVLNDSTLRHEAWKKDHIGSGSYMAASIIKDRTGAHLVDNGVTVSFSMKDQNNRTTKTWAAMMLDGSGSRTAPRDPFRYGMSEELEQSRQRGKTHDIIIASRSPIAGYQSRNNSKINEEQLFIADGGFSSEITIGGKGNSTRAAQGGVGAVLTETDLFPYVSVDQMIEITRYMPEYTYAMANRILTNLIQTIEKKRKRGRK